MKKQMRTRARTLCLIGLTALLTAGHNGACFAGITYHIIEHTVNAGGFGSGKLETTRVSSPAYGTYRVTSGYGGYGQAFGQAGIVYNLYNGLTLLSDHTSLALDNENSGIVGNSYASTVFSVSAEVRTPAFVTLSGTIYSIFPSNNLSINSSVSFDFSGNGINYSVTQIPSSLGGVFYLTPGHYLFTAKLSISGTAPLKGYSDDGIVMFAHLGSGAIQVIDSNDGSQIQNGGTAWITGSDPPLMPALQATFPSPTAAILPINWEFKSMYAPRKLLDDQLFTDLLGSDQPWVIPITDSATSPPETYFFGGDARVSGSMSGYPTQGLMYHIYGKNPDPAVAKNYITANEGIHWYAWAIAQKQSRVGKTVYNQFTAKGLPTFVAPGGWGMYKIEPLGKSTPVSTDVVWNWETNVEAALNIMDEKRTIAEQFFSLMQNNYGNSPDWESPPTTFVPPGTHTSMSPVDADTITLYNGAGGCNAARLWVDQETGQEILKIGGTCPKGANPIPINSCWRFNPHASTGNKWKCIPNSNNFLYKVIHDEYEGAYPVMSSLGN